MEKESHALTDLDVLSKKLQEIKTFICCTWLAILQIMMYKQNSHTENQDQEWWNKDSIWKGDRLKAKRTGIPAEHVLSYAVRVEHMHESWSPQVNSS